MSVGTGIINSMTIDVGSPDPYVRSNSGEMDDPYNPFGRPERTEDKIPRGRYGRPHIWLPDGSAQRYYSRPSSWGKKIDDLTKLSEWQTRTAVSGFLDFGEHSRTLRMEWAATGPEDKERRNQLCDDARHLVNSNDRQGTAYHAMTERHDLGLASSVPGEFEEDMAAYREVMKNFEIVRCASGRPGVEVFVAFDQQDAHGKPVRLAGTFDRLVRHDPCGICQRRNRITDLKTGSVEWGRQVMAVQLGIYAHGMEYIPWPDGSGADRLELPDVCPHIGFIINLRPGTGKVEIHKLDIASGYNYAVGLIPEVGAFRRHKNLMAPWTPVPSMWSLVDRCSTVEEVRALWYQYPGAPWKDNDNALTDYAMAKVQLLTGEAI